MRLGSRVRRSENGRHVNEGALPDARPGNICSTDTSLDCRSSNEKEGTISLLKDDLSASKQSTFQDMWHLRTGIVRPSRTTFPLMFLHASGAI